jgi:hypothetical protein
MDLLCKYGKRNWPDLLIVYFCVVKKPNITKPSIEIKEVCGDHQDGKSNENVEGLLFILITVNFIPRGLDVFFPNVTHLQIHNCGNLCKL